MLRIATVFAIIFVAELGDKTQLATLLFACERNLHPLLVFAAAAAALVLSTALAVLLGYLAGVHLKAVPFRLIAGIGFMVIGAWSLFEYARGA